MSNKQSDKIKTGPSESSVLLCIGDNVFTIIEIY